MGVGQHGGGAAWGGAAWGWGSMLWGSVGSIVVVSKHVGHTGYVYWQTNVQTNLIIYLIQYYSLSLTLCTVHNFLNIKKSPKYEGWHSHINFT